MLFSCYFLFLFRLSPLLLFRLPCACSCSLLFFHVPFSATCRLLRFAPSISFLVCFCFPRTFFTLHDSFYSSFPPTPCLAYFPFHGPFILPTSSSSSLSYTPSFFFSPVSSVAISAPVRLSSSCLFSTCLICLPPALLFMSTVPYVRPLIPLLQFIHLFFPPATICWFAWFACVLAPHSLAVSISLCILHQMRWELKGGLQTVGMDCNNILTRHTHKEGRGG